MLVLSVLCFFVWLAFLGFLCFFFFLIIVCLLSYCSCIFSASPVDDTEARKS